ncbi:MAG: histidine kinase dimerization/phospho-acceptor domain-containing protein, partial [Planctomycetota bacterium]
MSPSRSKATTTATEAQFQAKLRAEDENVSAGFRIYANRMRRRYFVGLVILLLLVVSSHLLLSTSLAASDGDARDVNLAGRQRMLSQRVASASLQTVAALQQSGDATAAVGKLETAADLISTSHDGLRAAYAEAGLATEFDALTPVLEKLSSAAAVIVAEAGAPDPSIDTVKEAARSIAAEAEVFLPAMNDLVFELDAISAAKLERTELVHLLLLGLALLTLLGEALLIFAPTSRILKQSASQIDRVAAERAEALAQKSDVLAKASHELRTPLMSLLGYAEMLGDERISESQRNEHARVLQRSGRHLIGLINDVLEYSRLQSGAMTIHTRVCHPVAIVADTVCVLRGSAVAKG